MALRWPTVLFTLLLSIVAGLLGAEVGIRRTLTAFPGPVSGGVQWALRKAISGELDLTEEQQQMVSELERTHGVKRLELAAALKQTSLEFTQQLQQDPMMGPAVIAAEERMHAASHASEAEAFAYVQDLRRVLRPDQQKVLDKKIQDAVDTVIQAIN